MQRDVKIGIAIGVLLIALIGIFWWARSNKKTQPPATPPDTAAVLPVSPEPVAPPVATPGSPDVTIPGAPKPVGQPPVAGAPTTTVGVAVVPPVPGAPTTTLAGAAVPPPITPATSPAPAAERKYKVVSGDSLAKIAKQFYGDETKFKVIADANKIGSPYALKPGQELVIPEVAGTQATPKPPATGTTPKPTTGAAPKTADAGAAKTHKVVAGDTLSKISKHYYGTDAKWKQIYEANKSKMKSPDDIQVGTELVIPGDK